MPATLNSRSMAKVLQYLKAMHTRSNRQSPKKVGANWQSQTAFYVSLATAMFSGFVWWQGRREERIKAAIEISRAYLQDENMEKNRKAVERQLPRQVVLAEHYPPAELPEIVRYFRRLEYLALLINEERVDPTYVAETMKCDIIRARYSLANSVLSHS